MSIKLSVLALVLQRRGGTAQPGAGLQAAKDFRKGGRRRHERLPAPGLAMPLRDAPLRRGRRPLALFLLTSCVSFRPDSLFDFNFFTEILSFYLQYSHLVVI